MYNLSTNQALFSERAEDMRPPASVEKLYTATDGAGAARARRPPGNDRARQRPSRRRAASGKATSICTAAATRRSARARFIDAHYGGLGTSVSTLVDQLVHTDGIHSVTGTVEGDESYFDSLRGEPSSGYEPDPYLEGTLSALAFNRGAAGSDRGPHAPAAYAAHELLIALKADGVTVAGAAARRRTPAGATPWRRRPRRR